jgi:hypothetical protein|nr:MAG TPA: Pulmonary surfactant-associated protein D, c-type lectin, alpha-helical coiled [Caudoviricetes sp.]
MAKIRLGNLKGPKGDRGEAGPRGPQGIQGPPGTAENIDLTPFVKKTEGATLTGQYTFTNNTPIKLNGYNIVSENNRILFKNADNKNVFAFDADTITHNDKSLLTQDKANTLYAPIGDYATRTALNGYATTTSLNNYVTTASANSTYLSKSDAESTYAKKTDVGNGLTLAQANDAYVSKAGDNNVTGTINISQTAGLTLANHIFESNPTNLVIKNKANQPILTIYPSVAYLNGREVLNQFKADQIYVKKDQYTNDMNSLLTALRNVNN